MPSREPWRKLLPGLVALALMIVGAVATIMFAGVGTIHGKTIRLYVVSDAASGVMHGTEVWVAGQKVGMVNDVSFLPLTSDTMAHVLIDATVRASDAQAIRHDSHPELRAGGSLVGPIVVYLTPGSPASSPVHDGDTLYALPQHDVQIAVARFSEATAELQPLMADARGVIAQVHSQSGTVGAFLSNGLPIRALRSRFVRLTTRDGTGEASSDLMRQTRRALAQVDSIRALVSGSNGVVGRFRRDSSLSTSVASLRDELTVLNTRLNDSNGTLGRARADAALTSAVAAARQQMSDLFADMRRHPTRYINF
jgi:phospholipid/cholesterol/gamma-HCH transport system substrate-binding protein